MPSHNSFRLLGYFYGGLCLCASFLLLINASQLLKQHDVAAAGPTNGYQLVADPSAPTGYRQIPAGSSFYPERDIGGIIIGIGVLIFSIISIIFDLFLIAGIVVRRTKYVEYHLKFVSILYALALVGLFVGCIIMGALVAPYAGRYTESSAALIAVTGVFIFGIALVSIFYALTVWILKGVISFIKYELVRFVPSEGGELI